MPALRWGTNVTSASSFMCLKNMDDSQRMFDMNKRMKVTLLIGLMILLVPACGQLTVTSTPVPTQEPVQPAPVVIESPSAPVMTPTTVANEFVAPAGWMTAGHAIRSCEVQLSYPANMQVAEQGVNSRLLSFISDDPDYVAANFIYVSIINEELQGSNEERIYNYDPTAASLLLNLQVGESAPLHANPQIASWYTYQRLPDTTVSGQTARVYENVRPWEFPVGTKEIRYYVSVNGCTYQIGGYLDTTGTNKPGMIAEDLFNQIIENLSIQL